MFSTFGLLLQSRKFWVGMVTVLAIASTVLLVALGKIGHDSLIPTITAVAGVGMTLIATIAWEDTAQIKLEAATKSSDAVKDIAGSFATGIISGLKDTPSIPVTEASDEKIPHS